MDDICLHCDFGEIKKRSFCYRCEAVGEKKGALKSRQHKLCSSKTEKRAEDTLCINGGEVDREAVGWLTASGLTPSHPRVDLLSLSKPLRLNPDPGNPNTSPHAHLVEEAGVPVRDARPHVWHDLAPTLRRGGDYYPARRKGRQILREINRIRKPKYFQMLRT